MQWNGMSKATHRDDNKTQCCTRDVAALRKDIVYNSSHRNRNFGGLNYFIPLVSSRILFQQLC